MKLLKKIGEKEERTEKTEKKKSAAPKAKCSVTCSDSVTAYVTSITNDSESTYLIGRNITIRLKLTRKA